MQAPNRFPGGNSEREPPDPIPNSEVKTLSADGSVGSPHVRVGHRQDLIAKSRSPLGCGFSFGETPPLSIGRSRPSMAFAALAHPCAACGALAALGVRPLAGTLAAFARAKAVLSLNPRSPSCSTRTPLGSYSREPYPFGLRLFFWRCHKRSIRRSRDASDVETWADWAFFHDGPHRRPRAAKVATTSRDQSMLRGMCATAEFWHHASRMVSFRAVVKSVSCCVAGLAAVSLLSCASQPSGLYPHFSETNVARVVDRDHYAYLRCFGEGRKSIRPAQGGDWQSLVTSSVYEFTPGRYELRIESTHTLTVKSAHEQRVGNEVFTRREYEPAAKVVEVELQAGGIYHLIIRNPRFIAAQYPANESFSIRRVADERYSDSGSGRLVYLGETVPGDTSKPGFVEVGAWDLCRRCSWSRQ